jgi:hypothetical protein
MRSNRELPVCFWANSVRGPHTAQTTDSDLAFLKDPKQLRTLALAPHF